MATGEGGFTVYPVCEPLVSRVQRFCAACVTSVIVTVNPGILPTPYVQLSKTVGRETVLRPLWTALGPCQEIAMQVRVDRTNFLQALDVFLSSILCQETPIRTRSALLILAFLRFFVLIENFLRTKRHQLLSERIGHSVVRIHQQLPTPLKRETQRPDGKNVRPYFVAHVAKSCAPRSLVNPERNCIGRQGRPEHHALWIFH